MVNSCRDSKRQSPLRSRPNSHVVGGQTTKTPWVDDTPDSPMPDVTPIQGLVSSRKRRGGFRSAGPERGATG
jgi:hypothetical protein